MIPSEFPGSSATQAAEPIGIDSWVPEPTSMNGRKHYLISDVIVWNLERIRPFEDALHPEFYNRLSSVPDASILDISPSAIDARIDVADQSARIYLGQFEPETVASTATQKGLTKLRDVGPFEIFTPSETGYQHIIGVSEDAVVVGTGAGIQMAGGDDRTSQIDSKTATMEVIDAHQNGGAYVDTNDAFRTLTKTIRSLSAEPIKTFERVSTPKPETLRFTGCLGIAYGFALSRPKSEYVTTFLFSDPSEAVTDPIQSQFERKPGLNEYDDISYTTDGSTVTVRARMVNDRFDGFLPGDPADRV
ncbi:hypothetical protein [Haladaptatus sp. NG-SE-30]